MYEDKNKIDKAATDTSMTPLAPEKFSTHPQMSDESVKLKVFDKDNGKDKLVTFNYEGLMAEAQRRENSGDLQGTLDILDVAERLVHGFDNKQSEKITFKMADTLHKISNDDNSGETKQAKLDRLDRASGWLDISNDYKKLHKLENKPEKLTTKVRRSFRMGKSAVFNAFKKL